MNISEIAAKRIIANIQYKNGGVIYYYSNPGSSIITVRGYLKGGSVTPPDATT